MNEHLMNEGKTVVHHLRNCTTLPSINDVTD